jgi:hypothetical protein
MTAEKMPEDSTLRRHYETHLKMTGEAGGKPSPQSTQQPAPSSPGQIRSTGGFMGWLKRLFGR